MLKENAYEEEISSKILKIITNDYSLSQSQQQTQTTDIQEEKIRTEYKLTVLGKSLQRILRSGKTRPTFYTASTFHNIFFKLKYRLASKDKNDIAYEMDCSVPRYRVLR